MGQFTREEWTAIDPASVNLYHRGTRIDFLACRFDRVDAADADDRSFALGRFMYIVNYII